MGSLLFGMDAEYAVQLVDILTEKYDVVLMNPPYGAMPPRCKQYARQHYPRTHNDYYAAFIEQAVNLCKEGGYVGALTGRTFLFLKSFQKLREEILRSDALPEIVWDLGFNVLDEATARYAAFTLRKRHHDDGVDWKKHPVTFFRLTDWDWDEKRVKFEEAMEVLKRHL
jgi:predicted RNA methylase